MGTFFLPLSPPLLLLSLKGFKGNQTTQIPIGPYVTASTGPKVGGRAPNRPQMALPGYRFSGWDCFFPAVACSTACLLLSLLPPPPFLFLVGVASRRNVAIAEVKPKWSEAQKGQTSVVSPFLKFGRPDPLLSRDLLYCVLTFSNMDKEILKKMMTFASCDQGQSLRLDQHCSESVLLPTLPLYSRVPQCNTL